MRPLLASAALSLAGCAGGKDTGDCSVDTDSVVAADGEWYAYRFGEPDPAATACEPGAGQFQVTCSGDQITIEIGTTFTSYDSEGAVDELGGSVIVRLGGELAEGNNDTLKSPSSGAALNREGVSGLGPASPEAYSSAVSLSGYAPGASADGAFAAAWLDASAGEVVAEVSGSFTVACP